MTGSNGCIGRRMKGAMDGYDFFIPGNGKALQKAGQDRKAEYIKFNSLVCNERSRRCSAQEYDECTCTISSALHVCMSADHHIRDECSTSLDRNKLSALHR